jgi:hypothetical protein
VTYPRRIERTETMKPRLLVPLISIIGLTVIVVVCGLSATAHSTEASTITSAIHLDPSDTTFQTGEAIVPARTDYATLVLTPVAYLPIIFRPRPPLFVGLSLREDGEGYIRGDLNYNVGYHLTRDLNGMTDADTIRSHNYQWYDPNPMRFYSVTWDSYYSVSTGYFKSSSKPDDPSWKWGNPWILPYDWSLSNGQTFWVDSQAFLVSGPHSGYTSFGVAVQYWKLVNRDKFLYLDIGDTKQYVHPGDITLWYDAGITRLELHGDILRREYYKGNLTSDTVQYIYNLTSCTDFPSTANNSQGVELPPVSFSWPDYREDDIATRDNDSLQAPRFQP